ncbi:hypothetical protein ZWY2020_038455 [Hordeum vulgare]|nr:hypothetical protein ZWY2020_038455 [Hordeum vulgare]
MKGGKNPTAGRQEEKGGEEDEVEKGEEVTSPDKATDGRVQAAWISSTLPPKSAAPDLPPPPRPTSPPTPEVTDAVLLLAYAAAAPYLPPQTPPAALLHFQHRRPAPASPPNPSLGTAVQLLQMLEGSSISNQKTLYEVLSVPEDATYDEIRAAYKCAALNTHPDKAQVTLESFVSTVPSGLPAANNRCKSLSCLVREAYAHCHVPCLGIPGAGCGSGDGNDNEEELDTKQVILNEMRNRETRKRSSRCSVGAGAHGWSFTPLHPPSSIEKCVAVEVEEYAAASDGDGDNESEAFFSVKSFFTSSTSRAATVASSTDMSRRAKWDGLQDCKGWPFGLCRRPVVPQLPSTPADSWKWRNRSSPAPAYTV